jgi:hypothetical protein
MPSEKDIEALKTRAVAEIVTPEELDEALKLPNPKAYIAPTQRPTSASNPRERPTSPGS